MKLITTMEQLKKNITTFDNYLLKGTFEQKDWIKKRILEGICFVAYSINNELRFAPSRFLGYVDNEINKHKSSTTKDGRKTNPAISIILGCEPILNEKLLTKYLDYCGKIGIEKRKYGSRGYARKFWEKVL